MRQKGFVALLLGFLILLTFLAVFSLGAIFFWFLGSKADLEKRFSERNFLRTTDFYSSFLHISLGQTWQPQDLAKFLIQNGYMQAGAQDPLRTRTFKLLSAEECVPLIESGVDSGIFSGLSSRRSVKPDRNQQVQSCVLLQSENQLERGSSNFLIAISASSSDGSSAFSKIFQIFGSPGSSSESVGKVSAILTGEDFSQSQDELALDPVLAGQFLGKTPILQSWTDLGQVPPRCLDAVLAIEDAQFLEHSGLSFTGLLRAFLSNLRHMRVTQGGSTITQQLVKNYFLTDERTYERKLREAMISLLLEGFSTKDQILETYLNIIYLGQAGAFEVRGIGAASQFYFGKPLAQLNLSECALIAAVINSPGRFHPVRHSDRAKSRRDRVLQRMQELGKITEVQHESAKSAPLPVRTFFESFESLPYYFDAALAEQPSWEGQRLLLSLDLKKQALAQSAVRSELSKLPKDMQAGLISIEIATGRVVALVGGSDWRLAPFNRVMVANRQIGSLVKPWLAYLGFLLDPELTSESLWVDEPISIKIPGGLWEPKNYDGSYRGSVSLKEAFALSLNLPFVNYGNEMGISKIQSGLSEVLDQEVPKVPSILLGSFEMTPFHLATAFYRLFATADLVAQKEDQSSVVGSIQIPKPYFVTKILDQSLQAASSSGSQSGQSAPQVGTLLSFEEEKFVTTFDESSVIKTIALMEEACRSGTGRAVRSYFQDQPVPCKTGTTSDLRDAWFVAASQGYLTLVWVGYDTPQSTGLTGSSGALPIWLNYHRGF